MQRKFCKGIVLYQKSLSSVNAKHWTSLLQNMLHFMAKKTGHFLHMKEMSLLSITIFFRSLVIRNSQRSIPDSSKDIIRVFWRGVPLSIHWIKPVEMNLYLPVRSGILISCLETVLNRQWNESWWRRILAPMRLYQNINHKKETSGQRIHWCMRSVSVKMND